jgi:2-C-methyl-D-erythritol 4-phosphate cytidylyltransferase
MNYWMIVPAAGIGARIAADVPKQYLKLHNKTILEHTLNKLLTYSLLEKVLVVLSPADTHWQTLKLQHPKLLTTYGGAERYHSVLNGLLALKNSADENDWVLVHDAARPCLQHADIDKLIKQVNDHPVGGILAAPLRDTVKQSLVNNHIEKTLDRNTLWQAFTPQMFRYGLLRTALQSAIANNQLVTDDAAAVELLGEKPILVEAQRSNIKITTAEDLKLAEFYLTSGFNNLV